MDASKIISLIDNTSLSLETETEDSIRRLVDDSIIEPHVAAICIYPKWISFVKSELKKHNVSDVKIATVVNFPSGQESLDKVLADTTKSIEDGADEVDLVINYTRILEDSTEGVREEEALVKAVAEICHKNSRHLKVIIESGELRTPENILIASTAALNSGADFIKTSTGKVQVNATLEAARIMLESCAGYQVQNKDKKVGFKAAGGVGNYEQANQYVKLAMEIMGDDWVTSEYFRFGASSLLKKLRA